MSIGKIKYNEMAKVKIASCMTVGIGLFSLFTTFISLKEGRLVLDPFVIMIFSGIYMYRGSRIGFILSVMGLVFLFVINLSVIVTLLSRNDLVSSEGVGWGAFSQSRRLVSFGLVAFAALYIGAAVMITLDRSVRSHCFQGK